MPGTASGVLKFCFVLFCFSQAEGPSLSTQASPRRRAEQEPKKTELQRPLLNLSSQGLLRRDPLLGLIL